MSVLCGCIDNRVGDDGVRALSDALKINTTLNTISLRCQGS